MVKQANLDDKFVILEIFYDVVSWMHTYNLRQWRYRDLELDKIYCNIKNYFIFLTVMLFPLDL